MWRRGIRIFIAIFLMLIMLLSLLVIAMPDNVSINHRNPFLNSSEIQDNYYLISLSNLPGGNGFYQQFIKINDPGSLGINQNGSNIEFTALNNTLLYAWIQSLNNNAMTVFVKNYNDSSSILLKVLPYSSNVLSSTGYTGEAPQLSKIYGEYDNGRYVFPFYCDFKGNSLNTGVFINNSVNSQGSLIINNGLKYTPTGSENNCPFMYSKEIFSYVTVQAYGNIYPPVYTNKPYDFHGYGLGSVYNINKNLEGIGRFCAQTNSQAGITDPIDETAGLNYGDYLWSLTIGKDNLYGSQYNASGLVNKISEKDNAITPEPIIFFDQINSVNPINFTWVRALTYLPSGMPGYLIYNSPAHYFSFMERGLPYGTPWYLDVFGSKYHTDGNVISIWLPGNNYSYSIYTPDYSRYIAYNQYGSVNSGNSNSIEIKFLEITYAVYFNGTGSWNLSVNGNGYHVSGSIKLCEPYGNYNYIAYYNGNKISGNYTVNGNNVYINLPGSHGNTMVNQTMDNKVVKSSNTYNIIVPGILIVVTLLALTFIVLKRK